MGKNSVSRKTAIVDNIRLLGGVSGCEGASELYDLPKLKIQRLQYVLNSAARLVTLHIASADGASFNLVAS